MSELYQSSGVGRDQVLTIGQKVNEVYLKRLKMKQICGEEDR